jgi:hypothetical protein
LSATQSALHNLLCASGFNFAPLRESSFSQRRKEEETEGAKGWVVIRGVGSNF